MGIQETIKTNSKLKEQVGEFVIQFSQVELYLTILCQVTTHPTQEYEGFVHYLKKDLTVKREVLKAFINEHLTSLREDWARINVELGDLNEHRRHLIHGIGLLGLTTTVIQTQILKSKQIKSSIYSLMDMEKLINRLHHLISGENGIGGVFYGNYKTLRFNLYNDDPDNTPKIIYKENGITMTKYTGD